MSARLLVLLALLGACSPRTAVLWLGGDVYLGTSTRPLFTRPPPALRGAAGIVNLEGPIAGPQPKTGRLLLVNAPDSLPVLVTAGVRVAGIANNHAGDAGPLGPQLTATRLRQAGLLPAGGVAGAAVLRAGALRVVITAHDLSQGVPAGLRQDLQRARKRGDVLISTFHVTGPPSYLPRPELRRAVEVALSAGAIVIAAHGSHSIARLERRGSAVIAWGLGNLLFDCDCTDETDAILLRVVLSPAGVAQATIIPVRAGLQGRSAQVMDNPGPILDLLEALGTRAFF